MKEKIANLLPHDKLTHFFVGLLIFVIASIFFNNAISFGVVTLIAIANEIRDEIKEKGKFDFVDILFTIAPAILLILKEQL